MTYKPKVPAGFILIDEAAKLTGSTQSALRVWELRYGWPKPQRIPGGDYRMYPRAILADLKRIVELASSGIPISTLIRDGQPVNPPRHTGTVARLRTLLRQAQAALIASEDPVRAYGQHAIAERRAAREAIAAALAEVTACECTPPTNRVLPPSDGDAGRKD